MQHRPTFEIMDSDGEIQHGEIVDLDAFDAVVFLGQWIRPLHYFGLTDWFSGVVPVSAALQDALFRSIVTHPFIPGSGAQQLPNEPLMRFPELMAHPERIILVPDPLPRAVAPGAQTRPAHYPRFYEAFRRNRSLLPRFYGAVQVLCREKRIGYCFQPASTFDAEEMTTHDEFAAEVDEYEHVNSLFYARLLSEALVPMLERMRSGAAADGARRT